MQFSNAGSGLRYHTDFNNAGEIRLDSAGSAATDERYVLSEYSIITISGSTVTPIGSPTTRDATAEEIAAYTANCGSSTTAVLYDITETVKKNVFTDTDNHPPTSPQTQKVM